MKVRILLTFAVFLQAALAKLVIDNLQVFVRGGVTAPRSIMSENKTDPLLRYPRQLLLEAGKRQMYLLGRHIATNYSRLHNFTLSDRSQIKIYSQNESPYIMASRIFVNGLIPQENKLVNQPKNKLKPEFKNGVIPDTDFETPLPGALNPIFVSLRMIEQVDYFFKLSSRYTCPNIKLNTVTKILQDLNKKFRFADSLARIKKLYNLMAKVPEISNTTTLYEAARVYEYLYILDSAEPNVVDTTSEDYLNMKKCYETYYTCVVSPPEVLRLVTAPTLESVVESINNRTAGIANENIKTRVFLGHDKFMSSLLLALGIINADCSYLPYLEDRSPSFRCAEFAYPSSNLIVELWKDDETTERYVRMRHNGDYVNFDLKESPSNHLYDVKEFIREIQTRVEMSWKEKCGLDVMKDPESNIFRWLIAFVVFNLMLLGLFVLGVYLTYIKKYNLTVKPADSQNERQSFLVRKKTSIRPAHQNSNNIL